MSEWNDINTNLPEDDEWVLVVNSAGFYAACNLIYRSERAPELGYMGATETAEQYRSPLLTNITHWMRVPKAPETGKA